MTARIYVTAGWKVFPLWWPVAPGTCACPRGVKCDSPGKHPVITPAHSRDDPLRSTCRGTCGRPGHGLHDATADLEQVSAWWTRWPLANVGLPAGGNGLAILDVDPPKGGKESLAKVFDAFERRGVWWPDTLIASTGGGGRHYVFTAPEGGVKNVANAFGPDLPGLDTRGTGGYIVAAPSRHASGRFYEWLDFGVEIAPWPDLLSKAMDWRPKPKFTAPKRDVKPGTKGEKYATAALDGEVAKVRMAGQGTRNHTLNEAAFNCGTLIGAGLLNEMQVRQELYAAALQAGLTEREAANTIASGLRAGMASPRSGVAA